MEADYIVVGVGSAGCVSANRLNANPDIKVILLEADGRDTNPWFHIPLGYCKTIHNPTLNWCYKTEPDAGLNGRSIEWPRGRVLGGSSSSNGLLDMRGQQKDGAVQGLCCGCTFAGPWHSGSACCGLFDQASHRIW